MKSPDPWDRLSASPSSWSQTHWGPTESIAFLSLGARSVSPAAMNQAFWKTYKSKVLQTLSGESEEDLAEEVGTIHVCWVGHGRGAAGVKRTMKDKGQAWGGGIFVQKQSAHSEMTNGTV